ncbi:MAG TPA: hypothetical protein VJ873_05360 [bacterium]|nr:hypothetical protein [bacterium]
MRNLRFLLFGALAAAGTGQFFLAQATQPWTFWVGIGFYGLGLSLFFKVLPPAREGDGPDGGISPSVEIPAFLFLAALTVFFRVYGINRFPDGVFADRAEVALGGLRILNDHWRPFLEGLSQHVPEVCIYYLAAGWIKLFGNSPEVFSYFDATLSVLGVLVFYWVFRQWTSPRTALLALFFLAVMRWNFVFGHQIYYQCQTVLFMAPALGLLFYSLGKKRWPFAALAGLTTSLGLYSYQAFKAFPLFVLLVMAYEFFKDRKGFKGQERSWAVFWLAFTMGAAPLLGWMMDQGKVGRREAEVSVFSKVRTEGSAAPLWRNVRDAALMFNRQGDSNSQSNFESHRMLDDVTGVFFVLGVGWALRRFKDRPSFYALAGLGVMSLPSLFSINGGHAGRMLGTTPFTALLCALSAFEVWARGRAFLPKKPGFRWGLRMGAAGLLAAAALLNFHAYFHQQASDPHCRGDFSWAETTVGRAIAGADPRVEFFLPSRFYGHPTVKFLTYPRWENMHPLDLSHPPQPSAYPPGTPFGFWEEPYNVGALNFLVQCYPGGKIDAFQDPLGQAALYAYKVPAGALRALKPGFPRLQRGLYGIYRVSGEDSPFLERWDPLINFTFRDLPLSSSSLRVHWTGRFRVSQEGPYAFQVATWVGEQARILIDGKENPAFTDSPALSIPLSAGWHRLELDFQKEVFPIAAVNLLWKRPGQDRLEFMPNDVFGPITAKNP